jgi:iron complex outermembrane receptor protein
MNVGIGVNNLLNTSYRDYLNRFRYYTDEMGTNVTLRLKIPFSIINPKSDEAKKP